MISAMDRHSAMDIAHTSAMDIPHPTPHLEQTKAEIKDHIMNCKQLSPKIEHAVRRRAQAAVAQAAMAGNAGHWGTCVRYCPRLDPRR